MIPQKADRLCLTIAILASCVLAALGWSSSLHLEILWDEQVDTDIADALRAHPFTGERPALDASQMRLPMYVTALAHALIPGNSLGVARAVSLAAGALTVIFTAMLGRTLFGPLVGALASILLALSPYFISFSRIAMTEGDVFFACCAVLALWQFVEYLKRPTPGRWAWCGICLGLALGAKFFAVFLFIVFAVLTVSTRQPAFEDVTPRSRHHRPLSMLCIAGLAVPVLYLGPLVSISRLRTALPDSLPILVWLIEFLLWCGFLILVLRSGSLPTSPMRRLFAMIAFAIMSCFVLMPVHLTQPDIALDLLRRTLRWDQKIPLALWSDHLRLYSGILLVKLSTPLGILTAGALVYAAFREKDDGRWRPCILSFVFYIVLICFLPLRQTFYLMGVYPMIVVLLAAFIVQVGRWLPRLAPASSRWNDLCRFARPAWTLLVAAMFVHLGVRGVRAYPYFHLYGYDVVGNRWLGAESRGYRNLIQTPSDGVEEMIRWLNTSPTIRRGDKVVSYLWEERIIDRLVPQHANYVLIRRGLSQESESLPLPPSIEGADFVLLHINNQLGYGDRPPDMPPADELRKSFEVVHVVRRGPIDVGWIYARRS